MADTTGNIDNQYTDLVRLCGLMLDNGTTILARSGRHVETKELELLISVEHASDPDTTMHVGFAPPEGVKLDKVPTPGPMELVHMARRALQTFGIDPDTL